MGPLQNDCWVLTAVHTTREYAPHVSVVIELAESNDAVHTMHGRADRLTVWMLLLLVGLATADMRVSKRIHA